MVHLLCMWVGHLREVVLPSQWVQLAIAKTFNLDQLRTSFTAGQRISLEWNKNTNTSDIYGMMVIFRLDN